MHLRALPKAPTNFYHVYMAAIEHQPLPADTTAKIGLVIRLSSQLWWPDPDSGTGRKGKVADTYAQTHLHATQVGGAGRTFTRPELGMHFGEIDDEHHELVLSSFIEVESEGPYSVAATLDGRPLFTSLQSLDRPTARPGSVTAVHPILLVAGAGPSGRRSGLLRIDASAQ